MVVNSQDRGRKVNCQSLSEEWEGEVIDAQNIANNSFTDERRLALGRKIIGAGCQRRSSQNVMKPTRGN